MRKILTLILGLAGFFVSLKLSQIYFDANFTAGYAGSFCSINSVVDCDGVARSGYSTFLGIPWAVYGVGFYLVVMILACFDFLKKKFSFFRFFEDFEHPVNYIYLMAFLSVFLSLYLAWISTFLLHKICVLCYVMYGINLLLFLLYAPKISIRKSVKVSVEDTLTFLKKAHNKKFFSVFFLLAFAFVFFVNQSQVFIPENFTYLFKGNVLGQTEAKAKIQVYSDYQCPYCAILNNQLYKLAHRLGDVKVELLDFPLDAQCNPLLKDKKGNSGSCLAARYAIASKKQCKFLEFNAALFRRNFALNEKNILKVASSVGLDVEKLKRDANSLEVKEKLDSQIQKALDTGILATPSIKVGLKIYDYFLPYDELYVIVSNYKEALQGR